MSWAHALLLSLIQGLTELFPVSSLGHAVVVPALLHLRVDEQSPSFLPFLVVLHVGTLVALLAYFHREWIGIARGLVGLRRLGDTENYLRLFGLIVVGTIPAVIVGFAFEKPLRHLFGAPDIAAGFLFINGLLLLTAERLRKHASRPALDGFELRLDALRWRDALFIGACQCAAFLPGISRSGSAMVGGLYSGLRHDAAARFSFLLTAPVVLAAATLEVPKLLHAARVDPTAATTLSLSMLVTAGAVSGLAAFLSTAFLLRYFRNPETAGLRPYGYYCLAFGALALALLLMR